MKTLANYSGILTLLFFSACGNPNANNSVNETAEESVENSVQEDKGELKGEETQEREINISEVPSSIIESIKTQYTDAKIEEAEEVTAEDGSVSYEIEIKTSAGEMELIYSADGQFISSEAEDDDQDNEDEEEEE